MTKKSNLGRFNFKGIYLRLYLAITMIMLIGILAVGIFSYSVSYNALIGQISNEKLNVISQIKNTADTTLKEIEKNFLSYSINPELNKLVTNPFSEDYEIMTQNIKTLVSLKNASEFIFSVYIYIPGKNLIVTTEDGYWKINDFYDLAWLESLKLETGGSYIGTRNIKTFSGENLGVTSYITPIPFDGYMIKRANLLVVNIYENKLYNLINTNKTDASEKIFLVDQNTKIISDFDKNRLNKKPLYDPKVLGEFESHRLGSFNFDLKGQKFLTTYVKSDYNNWSYISMIPVANITKPIEKIKFLNFTIAAVFIILGLIIAGFVSSRLYKPIKNTVSSARKYLDELEMTEDSGIDDEMEYITKTLHNMVTKTKTLSYNVWRNEATLKERFIMDLFLGNFLNEAEIEERLEQFNIKFESVNFYVFTLAIDSYGNFIEKYDDSDRAIYFYGIKNIVEEIMNDGLYSIIVQTDRDKFAVLINCSGNENILLVKADAIRENVNKVFDITLTIGMSEGFTNLSDISYMYTESIECTKARLIFGVNKTISYKEINNYNIPASVTSSLKHELIINYIKQGNIEEALKNINKINNTIIKSFYNQPEEIWQFYYTILNTAIMTINDNGWAISDIYSEDKNLYRELSDKDTISELFKFIEETLLKIQPFILEKKDTKNLSMISKVVEYMHNNYDKDITLNLLADYTDLSIPYISKLFKSEIGLNYLEYLTKLRIEKSKELLKDNKYNLSAIAEKVNLGNAQNFIRIFKKYQGMTPGQYRETLI